MKVLVIGGSEGIGRGVVSILAARGDTVTVAARHPPPAEAGLARVRFQACDLGRDSDVESLVAGHPGMDAVVLCAAAAAAGRLVDLSWEETERILLVNVLGTTRVCRLFAREMAARGGGTLVLLGSSSGSGSSPLLAAYGASKAYGMHLARSLAAEFEGANVTIRCVVPGATRTGFAAKAGLLPSGGEADPREVAAAVVGALDGGRPIRYSSFRVRLRCLLKQLLPAGFVDGRTLRNTAARLAGDRAARDPVGAAAMRR